MKRCSSRKEISTLRRETKVSKKDKSFDHNKNQVKSSSSKSKSKDVQCYNCKGYGHILTECPTKVKSNKKGPVANATWDNSLESESETDESYHDETESNSVLISPHNLST